MKKIIWGNTIVKNEGRYIWFAITSVIKHLDKILIFDTGSTDDTIKILKLLQIKYPSKIIFKEIGEVDSKGLTMARQRMLEETKSDWLILVDGDEVWWEEGIIKTVNKIQEVGDKLYALVNPVINLIGDIYHYQDDSSGRYYILGRKGHLNIRAVNRRIRGLHIKNDYPKEGFYDLEGRLLQDFGDEFLEFIDAPILHLTNLPRASSRSEDLATLKRAAKLKYELGKKFSPEFEYPEVFYEARPTLVVSPWDKMSLRYRIRSHVETPLKKVKRKFFE